MNKISDKICWKKKNWIEWKEGYAWRNSQTRELFAVLVLVLVVVVVLRGMISLLTSPPFSLTCNEAKFRYQVRNVGTARTTWTRADGSSACPCANSANCGRRICIASGGGGAEVRDI